MKVYVVSPDHDWDGLGEPIGVFHSMEDANNFILRVVEWNKRKPNASKFKYQEDYLEDLDKWEDEMPLSFPQDCKKYQVTCLEIE